MCAGVLLPGVRAGLDGIERPCPAFVRSKEHLEARIPVIALGLHPVVALVIGLEGVERCAGDRRTAGIDDHPADVQRRTGLAWRRNPAGRWRRCGRLVDLLRSCPRTGDVHREQQPGGEDVAASGDQRTSHERLRGHRLTAPANTVRRHTDFAVSSPGTNVPGWSGDTRLRIQTKRARCSRSRTTDPPLVALDKRVARAEDAAHLDTVDERG